MYQACNRRRPDQHGTDEQPDDDTAAPWVRLPAVQDGGDEADDAAYDECDADGVEPQKRPLIPINEQVF